VPSKPAAARPNRPASTPRCSTPFARRIAFHQVLGLQVLSVRHGGVRARIDMKPERFGHPAYGRLHGGGTAATLDAVGGLAGMVAIAEHHAGENMEQVMHRFARYGTIDMRVDFLRQGLGRYFLISTEVTHLGGRVASTLMRMHSDSGKLIATGAAAYSVG
jgi:uncharacterized protein (TIGR00369 family)